jgi:hypothetical protein
MKRETWDALYDMRTEVSSSWRDDFHNPITTMVNRGNNLVCHPYEIPLISKERPARDDMDVEYIKSIIKVCFPFRRISIPKTHIS